MAECLVALGSNLGDRAALLAHAVGRLAALPRTRLMARSAWHATKPIGGPPGQGMFLNGVARLATALSPREMFDALVGVETALGRTRDRRWEARAIDLDLLLHGDAVFDKPRLVVPHPRMEYRRFVLTPAAEVAPWMIHPTSGWTVASLLDQLGRGGPIVAVAAPDTQEADSLVAQLAARLNLPVAAGRPLAPPVGKLALAAWSPQLMAAGERRPRLILATRRSGRDVGQCRKILALPPTGPVAWLDGERPLDDAVAAVQAAWPELAAATAP